MLLIATFIVMLGVVIRLPMLPCNGTDDHPTFKLWSYIAATNLPENIYKLKGDVAVPTSLESLKQVLKFEIIPDGWQHASWNEYVDYPPVIPLILGQVGKLYACFSPDFSDSKLLNALVKVPSLIADLSIAVTVFFFARRRRNTEVALLASTLYWLNPMNVLAGALFAYQDSLYIAPLTVCLLLAAQKALVPSSFFYGLAVLCKPQAMVVLPALLVASASQGIAALGVCASVFIAVLLCVLTPYILHGTLINLIANNYRNASEPFISGQQCNLWWLVTYAIELQKERASHPDFWSLLQIKPTILWDSDAASAIGIRHARKLSVALYACYSAVIIWGWLKNNGKNVKEKLRQYSLSECAALLIYGQSMLVTQAHENHGFGAASIILATWWLGGKKLDRELLFIGIALSTIAIVNVITFYGFGPDLKILEPHNFLFFDFSILLSIANLALFVYWVWRWIRPKVGLQT